MDLKAEYPRFNLNKIANIVHACFGRRPDYRSVARVLDEVPVPLKIVRNYPPYPEARDVREARAAIVALRLPGWSVKAIAGYLEIHHSTVYKTLERWKARGFEGPADGFPGLGAFRVHAALVQMGFDLSRATCGRILAQIREVYGYEKPRGGGGEPRPPRAARGLERGRQAPGHGRRGARRKQSLLGDGYGQLQ